jgi:hypothetical protein
MDYYHISEQDVNDIMAKQYYYDEAKGKSGDDMVDEYKELTNIHNEKNNLGSTEF